MTGDQEHLQEPAGASPLLCRHDVRDAGAERALQPAAPAQPRYGTAAAPGLIRPNLCQFPPILSNFVEILSRSPATELSDDAAMAPPPQGLYLK